jgi:hypothetical protein
MRSKYEHVQVLFDNLPIQEATSIRWNKRSGHRRVVTPAGQGVMQSRLAVQVEGAIEVAIPRGGHEYDYNAALQAGSQITIRRVDLDKIEDAICTINSIELSDNFAEDRTCTVSFEGSVVE